MKVSENVDRFNEIRKQLSEQIFVILNELCPTVFTEFWKRHFTFPVKYNKSTLKIYICLRAA